MQDWTYAGLNHMLIYLKPSSDGLTSWSTFLSLTDLKEIKMYISQTEEEIIMCCSRISQNIIVTSCVCYLTDGSGGSLSDQNSIIPMLL